MINYKDLNLSEKELDELQKQLNSRKTKKVYEEYISEIEKNKEYIGKCFLEKEKGKEKYIRVLSSKSSNIYRFECMCFEFPIKMNERHRLTKIFNPENAFSNIDFESIYVEDYPLLCNNLLSKKGTKVINSLIPISEEDYFKKMKEYVIELEKAIKDDMFNTSKANKSIFER